MVVRDTATVTRRDLLQSTGGLIGCVSFTPASTRIATAQQEASITFNDQESNGESVVIASASTSVDARLLIVTGTSQVFRELQVEAGTEFTDRTVELTNPIQQSQTIRAELRTTDGSDELLARDRALIAVDESLASARSSTIQLPNGQAQIIEADPDAGFHHPYLLYKPETQQTTSRPLFVITHNDRPISTRKEVITQVRQNAEGGLGPALKFRLPGLIPAFPRLPDDGGDLVQSLALPSISSRDPLERIATDEYPVESLLRVDKQLTNMLDDAMERLAEEPYEVYDQIHMNGFSASAQFAARFTFLYPNRVNAISIGGNGAYPLPKASIDGVELPYPLGTADYQTITGRAFDVETWKTIQQFIYVGQEDQPLPSNDQQGYYPISYRHEQTAVDVFGKNRVTERLPVTRSVYQDVGADATFNVYEGVGHTVTRKMARDFFQFHRNTSRAPHTMVELTISRSADRVKVGEAITVTVQIQSRVTTTATVPVTLSVDGQAIETTEAQIQPDGSKEVAFEYTFDKPGSHMLSVNGLQVGNDPVVVQEPTPTPTESPTATVTTTPTAQPTTVAETPTESTSANNPGFGIGAAISAIAGVGYYLKRQREES